MTDDLPPGWRRGLPMNERRVRNATDIRTDGHGTFLRAIGAAAGLTLSGSEAMGLPTLFRCVSYLADTIGTLPLKVMREGSKGSVPALKHELSRLLEYPNPYMTGVDFRVSMAANQALYGASFAKIVRDRLGRPAQLLPLPSCRVKIKMKDGVPTYEVYNAATGIRTIESWEDILHLRGGPTFNGIETLSADTALAATVKLAWAIDAHQHIFHENGGESAMIITFDPAMQANVTAEQMDKLRMQIEHRNRRNNAPVIMPKGARLEKLDISARDAMTEEARQRQDRAICQAFGVPPHEIGIGDPKYANAEQAALAFVRGTVAPWCVKWEAAIAGALLPTADKATHVLKHNLSALVRGDLAARSAAYAVGRQNGWLSANDIREFEDMPKIDGGDEYLSPLNMVPAGSGATGNPGTQTTRQSRIPQSIWNSIA